MAKLYGDFDKPGPYLVRMQLADADRPAWRQV
jgi:hypothetical protein